MNSPNLIRFFATPPQPCAYLPARDSISLFAEPGQFNNTLYSRLAQLGFRRSGDHVYRPHCQGCQACVAVRIPAARFTPRRRDRRCLARNADLSVRIAPAAFSDEHFALYRRYLTARHPGGGMDEPTPTSYRQFLIGSWSQTWFVELRQAGQLVGVAVTDQLEDGLSAVYTYYEPTLTRRSLGHFSLLQQIDMTARFRLPYLYLGYWVEGSQKMAYKGRYRPLQAYQNDTWTELD